MSLIDTLHWNDLKPWLSARPLDAHKGMFGHVFIIGGDYGMPGAVRIAAEGALRLGSGLVTVLTRPEHVQTTVCGRPEILCYGINELSQQLDELCSKASIIVIGPGLGQSRWSKQLFNQILSYSIPLLIDADGLNLLAHTDIKSRQNQWILTPHPGEAARLLNTSIAHVQSNRPQAIQALQKRYGGVIVLKGHQTLVYTAHQPIKQCQAGNPGMASAGMGDLLSGVIASLVGQKLDLWQAAQAGVFLHAMAGDRCATKQGQRGLLATDLLTTLRELVNH